MAWGQFFGCHQMSSRSFFFKGYQLPVCARCTGVLIGQFLAIIFILFLTGPISTTWSVAALTVMFLDWLVQKLNIAESTNSRRLVTGVIGGYGFWTLLAGLIGSWV